MADPITPVEGDTWVLDSIWAFLWNTYETANKAVWEAVESVWEFWLEVWNKIQLYIKPNAKLYWFNGYAFTAY